MPFILSEQRDADVRAAFSRYQEYLESVRHTMPPSAFALASSDWYFTSGERSPHDAWLEGFTISEPSEGERHEVRQCSIRVRLRPANHDGFLIFTYPKVFKYQLDAADIFIGHRDWRYDEFRVSEEGYVIHEIEWWGGGQTARWIIEASDVEYEWEPEGVLP